MTRRAGLTARLRDTRGTTLIELLSALSVMAVVVGSLYLLLGAGIKGRMIVHARVSDQERGRQAMSWVAERIRQVSYDPQAACPDGLVRMGNGTGFRGRLAFRAVLDERLASPRRLHVFYLDDEVIWQETRVEAAGTCLDEAVRHDPDSRRAALTPRIVRGFDLTYFDADGNPTDAITRVRSIGIRVRLEAESTPGRFEPQTYHTVVTIRGF